jgi:hypothetical protein
MAASSSAFTDPSRLVPLLYRADWTQLCLAAEIEARIQRLRSVMISPGQDFWRPVTEYDYLDYLDYLDDQGDQGDQGDLDRDDEDPRVTWRLASKDDAAGDANPPGTRVVEGSGPLALLDIPAPLHAAWTAGKAGVAGASAVAGWLQQRMGNPGERDRRAEDDQGSS